MSVVIGVSHDRLEGTMKIMGAAQYAGDFPADELAYAVPVQSAIARGRILKIDSRAAEKAPGFLAIISRANAPKLHMPKNDFGSSTKLGEARALFQDDQIHYFGQYLAIVVADSLERALFAASQVEVIVEEEPPVTEMDRGEKFQPPDDFAKTAYSRGDVAAALKSAPHRLDRTYSTPVEHHNPMEPSAAMAVWEGNKLTLYDATQWVVGSRNVVADTFGIPRDDVRIVSRFVGGGFGCKGFVWPHSVCAAIAARQLGRPVKLVLTRQQMFTSVGHRGATLQNVSIGASGDGKLLAIQHENLTHASMVDDYIERCGVTTGFLYNCPNISIKNTGVRVNIATPTPMRAPGETPGLFAIESALDELAWELNMCPVKLRLKNYAETDPEKGKPYSSKHLRECYEVGMERFGWSKREPKPRAHRDGRYLVGWGMATSTYPGYRSPGAARVRMLPDGLVHVESATQDIGTGTYTTMAQVASETLGVSTARIRVALGDSSLPPAPVSGGSMTTASVTPAVKAASEAALKQLKELAVSDLNSPLHGLKIDEITSGDGYLRGRGDRQVSYNDLLSRAGRTIEATAQVGPGSEAGEYAFHSFGAQFSEVRVDSDTGEVRVSRHVAVFDIGRIINPKTCRSQAFSGITMGIGMALLEHTVYDREHGRVITNNLADYAVPVNADVPAIDVHFVEYPDYILSSVGGRGIGEIGITGVAPAIANAIYHASGIRVRELPITPDKLIS